MNERNNYEKGKKTIPINKIKIKTQINKSLPAFEFSNTVKYIK